MAKKRTSQNPQGNPEEERKEGTPDPIIVKIKRILVERKISQDRFEKMAQLRDGRFTHWMHGRGEISIFQLLNMARVLDIPVQSLIEDQDVNSSYMRKLTPDEVAILTAVKVLDLSQDEAIRRLRKSAS